MRWAVLLLLAYNSYANDLQALADQARALPPEFAADVLLKLAGSPLATDAQWKRGVIEDAFLSATHASVSYRQQGPSMVAQAQSLSRLDSLTLQTRAVEAMAAIDPQRALAMFGSIPAADLPKLSCREALTPDLSSYYQMAASLFVTGFSREQREKEVDIAFLRGLIGAITSPSQVVPALRMLAEVGLRENVRSELMATFGLALDRVNGGSREFAASEPLLVSSAVPEMHERGFLPSLRAYIVRHAKGPRCSDTIRAGQLTESVSQFNKLLSRIDPSGTRFHPIATDEATPSSDEGTYAMPGKSQSDRARKVSASLAALRQAQQSTSAWTAHYLESLSLLEEWKPEDEASPEEYALLVARNLNLLLESVPAGPTHQAALSHAIHFLEQQYDASRDHRAWFVQLRILFDGELAQSRTDREWLVDQLVNSRNPSISVYGQLKRLLSSS